MSICCPKCNSTNIKQNGQIHNGKQNHYCQECQRQFVQNPRQKIISDEEKEQIRKLLLEGFVARAIARANDNTARKDTFTRYFKGHRS
jgi:transposase-like protein